jgi:phage gp36-like protein
MPYLTPGDYRKTIQADNLQQVIGSLQTVLSDAEDTAIEEVQSYLVQKYIISQEFQDTPAWSKTNTYKVFNRVYLDAPIFSATTIYVTGDLVSYLPTGSKDVGIYKSKAGSAAHAFNAAEWDFKAYQYAIYNAKAPKPVFNYTTIYKVGDQVFWHDKVYTCKIPSTPTTQATALQYGQYNNVPFGNVFPDDVVNGLQYWGAGVAYSIAINADIFDATKWEARDNRSKQVVWCCVVLALYYSHARISPRNIPDIRVKDYDDAIKKLKRFAEGDTTNVALPLIQPKSGGRIRWGGNVKHNNSY